MKILKLEAENFKRLKAVEIAPQGNVVQITGANASGKTSTLDSIWAALAGLSVVPPKPIRKGETQAKIRIDLGELIVTRLFKEGKPSTITVENAEGTKVSSPQTLLDGLMGQLSFDPLAFSRMTAKEQFNTLRRFVPDIDFDQIEADNKADYDKRTAINRKAKEAKTLAETIVVPPTFPKERIDTKKLLDELQKAANHNADIEIRKSNRKKLRLDIESKRKEIIELQEKLNSLTEFCDANQKKLDFSPLLNEPIDISALRQRVDQAEQTNKLIALLEEKEEHLQAAKELEKESDNLTKVMQKRDSDKLEAIKKAKLPVKSLGFGEGEILMNGLPFCQASDAEQLRASVAIAMAFNPKLRVIRIRDGSLLDENSLALVSEMADKNDCQVWIESVDTTGKVGIYLEEGLVKSVNGKETDLVEDDFI